jgi:acyl-homoserine lactone acylase PvdQ
MRRSAPVLSLIAIALATLMVPAHAAAPPPTVSDDLKAYSITPPGQDGTITSDEFISGDYGPHYDDQLGMYAALIDDNNVTDAEMTDYFHSMQFGVDGAVERSYSPTTGVTVYRDASFGIPHIFADSMDHAAFALGYVAAEDRMFQMDAFRHAARGTLAAFVGAGSNDSNLKSDIETRREGYTEAEIDKMFNQLDDKYGKVGKHLQTGLQAYTDGVNEYISELQTDPSKMPVEYAATNNPPPTNPKPWSVEDTLYIVVLQLRVFGETAGTELKNAAVLQHLRHRDGKKAGTKLYHDLLFNNDPKSPTTLSPKDADFFTQNLGKVDPSSVAIPDHAVKVASKAAAREAVRWKVLESMGFRKQISNALVVSGRKSATGHPLLSGGPQVGHAIPSFFMDVDVHAPGIDFRGPAVPGTNALIPLGRGTDYAWTLTTGYSDAVDTRAELLCDPAGGDPTIHSNGYMFKGKCKKMSSRTETFDINPQPTDPGPPRSSETRTFYRTQHGPVFQRGTVGGKPVAFVKQRFFWKKEIDSLPSFYKWNTGVHSIADFKRAASKFTMSFNSFYADSNHIGYFHVGEYPLRRKGMSVTLPTWGTGAWEWKGRRPYRLQPKIVNPGQGWLSNWNNKPARHWDNQDGFKWGRIQRMQLLSDQMHKLLDHGKAKLSDIADVLRTVATQDARGVYLAPAMVRLATKGKKHPSANFSSALDTITSWHRAGAHRSNKDHNDTMDEGPSLAIFDAWYNKLVHRVFDDEIGIKGYDLLAAVDAKIVDFHPTTGGGFWFDFSSYLRNIFDPHTRKQRFDRNPCDNSKTKGKESCALDVSKALSDALAQLKKEQGSEMSKWTEPAENIQFSEQGAGSASIPWQNRGSENHLVEVLSDAP